MRASDSLDDPETRPHVFVASGTYAEGDADKTSCSGYRRDFVLIPMASASRSAHRSRPPRPAVRRSSCAAPARARA